jgi:hypothetical protein
LSYSIKSQLQEEKEARLNKTPEKEARGNMKLIYATKEQRRWLPKQQKQCSTINAPVILGRWSLPLFISVGPKNIQGIAPTSNAQPVEYFSTNQDLNHQISLLPPFKDMYTFVTSANGY